MTVRLCLMAAAAGGAMITSAHHVAVGSSGQARRPAITLANKLLSLEFLPETGALVGMRNLSTGGEYLKEPGGDGNPFRAYVDTTEVPRVLQLPFPWPVQPVEGPMGGTLLDPRDCQLTKHTLRRRGGTSTLTLVSKSTRFGLTFELTLRLRDSDTAADLDLTVRNTGSAPHTVMVAHPYFTGLGLGRDRSANLGVRLVGFGQGRGAAWENIGDLYGRIWSGQWNAVYDEGSREALGVIAKDRDLRNKVVRRFPDGGMSVFYTDNQPLQPGQAVAYPTAQLLVYAGDWKPTARKYGAWFASAFKLRKHAKWLDDVDAYMGSWIPHPADVARDRAALTSPERSALDPDLPRLYTKSGAFASFEHLPRLYTPNTFDMQEWAQYWQSVIVHNRYHSYHHVDGIYDFRDDLGGLPAFAEGVARVRQIGRHVGLYIGSKTIRYDSRIFAGEFAGTRPEDWMLMETPDATAPGPDEEGQRSIWACPRHGPWQDHLARLCKDLLRRTGAKYIRLDELGEAFVVCHNPKHHHASPYAGTQEILQFLKKVRAAMDEVDPQAALYTEGAGDLMQISCDGTLAMWASGSEIAPMRLVIPDFVGLAYNLGQVECALQGWVTYVTDACSVGGWWNPHHAGLWGSGLVKRPPGYPAEGKGAGLALRWHEAGATFVDAVRRGTPADRDPVADGKPSDEWAGRIWMARDPWVMTCGDLAARVPDRPVMVRVPGLPADVHHAFEIDLATLTVRDARLQRSGSDATVTLAAGFSAVLLPRPTCPPLVQVDDVPPLTYGQATVVHIKAFAPWRTDSGAVAVTVSMPGLLAAPKSVVLPAAVRLEPRTGAEPGFYALKVTGRALPLKRWIRYGESDQ